jgi:hypothetical protein
MILSEKSATFRDHAPIANRGVNRILEYLVTAFADLIHPATDFDQQAFFASLALNTSKSGTADVRHRQAPEPPQPPAMRALVDPIARDDRQNHMRIETAVHLARFLFQ